MIRNRLVHETSVGDRKSTRGRMLLTGLLAVLSLLTCARGQDAAKALAGFDAYMTKTLHDWNVAGAGVGVVVKDKVILAKGYGFRDYEKKLPVTPNTLYQIASNTKLFTAVAVGMLVDEGKIDWDRPVREYVPQIRFYNDELNNTVTIRDMLAHRTGISRHDMIWYGSDFTRKELFDRVKYLEPSQPLRQGFLYNNMMYAASGYIVELLSGKSWEEFVRERIFTPLGMKNTMFSVKEMEQQDDHGVPYNEKRDTTILYRIPIYEEAQAIGPAGSIISNIHDMCRWLTALMNKGKFEGRQVIPEDVVRATLAPSIAMPNTLLETRGYTELLNPAYGMARWTASYRGHFLAYHGGDIDGFHSQISCMPYDSIGVVVFVIGDHGAPLYNIISYNVYERLLGLHQTPWSERRLKDRLEGKKADREARQKSGAGQVVNTRPSHPLAEYAGQFEHPAYGTVTITRNDTALGFNFHNIHLPLRHFHYDRFDTPNDERFGLFSLSFLTSPNGMIDRLVFSLDESEATFVRTADAALSDPKVLEQYAGSYQMAGGVVEIVMTGGNLSLVVPGQPKYQLIPSAERRFTLKQFADTTIEFVVEGGRTVAFKQIDPSGEYRFERKK